LPWEWLKTAGEALLVAAVFTLGMLVLLQRAVLWVVMMIVFVCTYPIVSARGATEAEPKS